MLKIFDAKQIKEIDKYTVEEESITSIDLMERAALSIFEYLAETIDRQLPVYVFAGGGNNGGDALALSRMLLTSGIKPKVYLVSSEEKYSQDCGINKERLERLIKINLIKESVDIPELPQDCIVIDGLFGSGINRPLNAIFAEVVKAINKSKAKVYSIDIPSGMFLEDNSENDFNAIVKADEVFSFQFPKLSLLLPDSNEYCQHLTVLDIGLFKKSISEMATDYCLTEQKDVSLILHRRQRFSHKGDFGHAFLVAGSKGKMGAAVLASQACLRTGVGLLTVHIPQCGYNILQAIVPEAMADADINENFITQTDMDLNKMTVGIGSGIGKERETKRFLSSLLESYHKPMVVDADALNMIGSDDMLKYNIPENSILTPHPIEFDRLAGEHSVNGYDRLQKARKFAADHKVIVVLKGAYTAVISTEGKVYFNPTGNPGMATGGSGDALTGVITSLLAQKYSPFDAARLGVYLHGLAGDLAAKTKSEYSMLPSDLINYIGKAYRRIERG
ncbi:MAG: NAD(P)H-hydrate dehydratase [Dysgonomonas sp.]